MARRYVRVVIEMIADITPGTGQLIKDDLMEKVLGMEALEAGEVDVEVQVLGEVKVNKNGYAVPWVEIKH